MHLGWKKLITMGKNILVKETTFNPNSSKGFGCKYETPERTWKGRGEKIEPSLL